MGKTHFSPPSGGFDLFCPKEKPRQTKERNAIFFFSPPRRIEIQSDLWIPELQSSSSSSSSAPSFSPRGREREKESERCYHEEATGGGGDLKCSPEEKQGPVVVFCFFRGFFLCIALLKIDSTNNNWRRFSGYASLSSLFQHYDKSNTANKNPFFVRSSLIQSERTRGNFAAVQKPDKSRQ